MAKFRSYETFVEAQAAVALLARRVRRVKRPKPQDWRDYVARNK